MAADFLTDQQVADYGHFVGVPSQSQLERYFHLDDADRERIDQKRRNYNRLGFGLQLGTVRMLGTFLADPLDVPTEVVDYVAGQLGIDDPSCVKAYSQREPTHREHAGEIQLVHGYRDFGDIGDDFTAWLDARAWTTGDGPKALFDSSIGWLIERKVLLPGVTTLVRVVGRVRAGATQRIWETLHGLLTPEQVVALDHLLEVTGDSRTSELERLRRGPVRASGPQMEWSLDRAAEIAELGFSNLDVSAIPPRRLAELARYGLDGEANLLRRHPPPRRLATVMATMLRLEASAIDDALDLLDILITTKLLARAERESAKEQIRTLPRFAKASSTLAIGMKLLLSARGDLDDPDEDRGWRQVTLGEVWADIEAVVPRRDLAAAVDAVLELAPTADSDADEAWRTELVKRFATVRPFLCKLAEVPFGSTNQGAPVLAALRGLPDLIGRKKVMANEIDDSMLIGSWRRLVLSAPHLDPGTADWRAYVFCVLEQFHRHLKRRDIFATTSIRWSDPRSKLLSGDAWERAKPTVLASLNLPLACDNYLAELAQRLDETYRSVAERLPTNTEVSFDEAGRLHLAALTPELEPDSLIELRTLVNRMLPRVDISEVLLEVANWTGYRSAFTSITGGESRIGDLDLSIAALLVAQACNIGLIPVIKPAVASLTRDRLSHVDQNYFRFETFKQANAMLVEAQAEIPLARLMGGGMVASVDGLRFVVPIASINARPNPKYFSRGAGVTWLNMVNDQGSGLSNKLVAGTPRDSLYVLDVINAQDGGRRPEMIVTDTASYSDIVFGLLTLGDWHYAPQLADLPDQRTWRIDRQADYGPLQTAARGVVNLDKIRLHWEDILRIIASIHTGAVNAYDVIRMVSRDGSPTPLGDAIAHYGRIHKSLHILRLIDDQPYRRIIKGQQNIQEGRHALGRKIFHGSRGELRQRYQSGMEDQLGALGLVLNAIVLFNLKYMNTAVDKLRADGHPVTDEDAARLSPFVRKHINLLGRHSFHPPELPGGLRPLRDPNSIDEDEEPEWTAVASSD